jgi:hypothetical protein
MIVLFATAGRLFTLKFSGHIFWKALIKEVPIIYGYLTTYYQLRRL